MLTGIVLAAGRSERMGRTKALLDARGRTFLAAVVSVLREGGCDGVVTVVRADAEEVARQAEGLGTLVVRNGVPDAEQADSLRLGLDAVSDDATAVVVLPVDHPLVQPATVARLAARHAERPAAVVRPVFEGRPGHPTLFPRSTWPALRDGPLPRGARSVVESPAFETVDVHVPDAGVLADIDTPARYRKHVGGRR